MKYDTNLPLLIERLSIHLEVLWWPWVIARNQQPLKEVAPSHQLVLVSHYPSCWKMIRWFRLKFWPIWMFCPMFCPMFSWITSDWIHSVLNENSFCETHAMQFWAFYTPDGNDAQTQKTKWAMRRHRLIDDRLPDSNRELISFSFGSIAITIAALLVSLCPLPFHNDDSSIWPHTQCHCQERCWY